MKVLITGGAGYVGNELTVELLKNPIIEKIIIYDNLSRSNFSIFLDRKYAAGIVRFVKGEILDTRKVRMVLSEVDAVVHLASKVSTPLTNHDSHYFEQINHWGTAELVYAVEESNVTKFINLSTANVYGNSKQLIDIETKPAPNTFYGSSKLRGEKHVQRLFDKIQAYNIRGTNIFGYSPSMRFDSVLNKFMFDANFVGRIQIMGDGEQIRSFIHIKKVVNVLHNLLINDFKSGTYNLVGKNLSINQAAKLVNNLYPDMEKIYVNQHLTMESLAVKHDERIQAMITMKPQSIEEDLLQLKEKFSFSSVD